MKKLTVVALLLSATVAFAEEPDINDPKVQKAMDICLPQYEGYRDACYATCRQVYRPGSKEGVACDDNCWDTFEAKLNKCLIKESRKMK